MYRVKDECKYILKIPVYLQILFDVNLNFIEQFNFLEIFCYFGGINLSEKCVRAMVKQVPNLKKPHLLIADKFRHQVSTIFARFELPKDQQDCFIRHMGHSEAINKNVYQCPMATQEITRVGKMLSNIDNHAFTRENVHEAPHDM